MMRLRVGSADVHLRTALRGALVGWTLLVACVVVVLGVAATVAVAGHAEVADGLLTGSNWLAAVTFALAAVAAGVFAAMGVEVSWEATIISPLQGQSDLTALGAALVMLGFAIVTAATLAAGHIAARGARTQRAALRSGLLAGALLWALCTLLIPVANLGYQVDAYLGFDLAINGWSAVAVAALWSISGGLLGGCFGSRGSQVLRNLAYVVPVLVVTVALAIVDQTTAGSSQGGSRQAREDLDRLKTDAEREHQEAPGRTSGDPEPVDSGSSGSAEQGQSDGLPIPDRDAQPTENDSEVAVAWGPGRVANFVVIDLPLEVTGVADGAAIEQKAKALVMRYNDLFGLADGHDLRHVRTEHDDNVEVARSDQERDAGVDSDGASDASPTPADEAADPAEGIVGPGAQPGSEDAPENDAPENDSSAGDLPAAERPVDEAPQQDQTPAEEGPDREEPPESDNSEEDVVDDPSQNEEESGDAANENDSGQATDSEVEEPGASSLRSLERLTPPTIGAAPQRESAPNGEEVNPPEPANGGGEAAGPTVGDTPAGAPAPLPGVPGESSTEQPGGDPPTSPDATGSLSATRHVYFTQTHEGVEVQGGRISVHIDETGTHALAVANNVVPRLGEIDPDPELSVDEAITSARRALPHGRLTDRPVLRVYPGSPGGGSADDVLGWMVSFTSPAGDVSNTYVIDAHTGRIADVIDLTRDANYREVWEGGTREDPRGAFRRREGDKPTHDSEVDRAYDFSGHTYDYYKEVHSRTGFDGKDPLMLSSVRADTPNAAWNGAGATLYRKGWVGDGPDIVGHEWTHAVTQHSAGLWYYSWPGAINESMSDVFGEMTERYAKSLKLGSLRVSDTLGTNDWLVGKGVPGGPIRSMADPSSHNQPEHMSEAYRGCADSAGVHINSGIVNFAFYKAAQRLGRDKAERIWYRALTKYLGFYADFTLLVLATKRSATDLYGDSAAEAVGKAFEEVGVRGRPQDFDVPPLCFRGVSCFIVIILPYIEGASSDDTDEMLAAMYRVRDELLPASAAREEILNLYQAHTARISELLLADSALREGAASLLKDGYGGLQEVMEGSTGETVVPPQLMTDFHSLLVSVSTADRNDGGGELAEAIDRVRTRLYEAGGEQSFDQYAGMTFREAWSAANERLATEE